MSEEYKLKGNNDLKNGNIQSAIDNFTLGINVDPDNAILYSNRSAAYSSLQLWKESLLDSEKAIELRPKWAKAYSRKGFALYKLGRFEESIQAYNKAIEYDPSNANYPTSITTVQNAWKGSEQNVLGEEALLKGKLDVALPFLKEAVKLDPNSALYWSNLSLCYCNRNEIEDALKSADKVILLRPKWHKGFQRKAEAFYRQQEYKNSASMYAYALQIEPKNEQLNSGFSRAHCKARDPNSEPKKEKSTWASIKDYIGL